METVMTTEHPHTAFTKKYWMQAFLAFVMLLTTLQYMEYNRLEVLRSSARVYTNNTKKAITVDAGHSLWGLTKATVYIATFCLSIITIQSLLFSTSRKALFIGLLLIFISVAADLTSRRIFGNAVSLEEVDVFLGQFVFAEQAIDAYHYTILTCLLQSLVYASGILLARKLFSFRIPAKHAIWLLPLSMSMSFAMINYGKNRTPVAYPAFVRIPAMIAIWSSWGTYQGERQAVSIPNQKSNTPRMILLVVDESVRADHLGVNGYTRPTTPKLSENPQVLTFGSISSCANKSTDSNYLMRCGLQLKYLPDKSQAGLRKPTIFHYAKNAGYKTYYLDAQGTSGKLMDHMNREESKAIDVFWQVSQVSPSAQFFQRDYLIADKVREISESGVPSFVYINKWGCHFHYESCYPKNSRVFEPIMPEDKALEQVERQLVVNSYDNSIVWSVDGFLDNLFTSLDYNTSLVLYTSDHGQSIKEVYGMATHGAVNSPPSTQALVPLIAWGQIASSWFPDRSKIPVSKLSQFQLFSSALQAMGYDPATVVDKYGPAIWEGYPANRKFISGDVFGRSPFFANDFDITGVTP